jgi:2',3'-cyclic-nucleotide 2'-phosphodiesterase (5'-nucleotidase family)
MYSGVEDADLLDARESAKPPASSHSPLGGALRGLAFASVGAIAAWCLASQSNKHLQADLAAATELSEKVKMSKCKIPEGWCEGTETRKDHLSYEDCDGDGLLDPYCTGGQLMRFGYISSANDCEDNWPNGLCKLEAEPDKKLVSTSKHAAPNEITIIHFNDVYNVGGVLEGDVRSGGMSRAAYTVKKERERNPDRTFVVFAGDALSPSVLSDLFKGEQMIDILNKMQLDAASLGNHEFDFGVDMLQTRLKDSNFPWLNINLGDEKGKLLGNTTKYFMKEVPWGPRWGGDTEKKTIKVCMFGVAYDVRETMFLDGDKVSHKDVFESSEKAAEHLRNEEKCTVVIPMTHQFSKEDCELSKKLDTKVDLILGGHDHSTEFTSVCGHAPFVKAASDLKTQWIMTIWLDDDGSVHHIDGRIISLTETDPFDIDIHDKIVRWEDKAEKELGKVMGCFATDFDSFAKHNRQQETNAGDWFTDAMRGMHKTDVAMWNGGAIRGDKTFDKGDVTRNILTQLHPFGNSVVKLWATGAELKEFIEHSLHCYEKVCGDFVQISGLKYEFDPRKPEGKRLVRLLNEDGSEVEDDKKFTVAVSDYMQHNSNLLDNKLYKMVTLNDKVPVLMALFQAAEKAGDECVKQEVEGRITNLAEA